MRRLLESSEGKLKIVRLLFPLSLFPPLCSSSSPPSQDLKMHLSLSAPQALQSLLSLLYLLLVSQIAACPLDNHESQHATTPITARDRDREVARRFAASLISSNGTLIARNIISPPGGGTVCHSCSLVSHSSKELGQLQTCFKSSSFLYDKNSRRLVFRAAAS